MKEIRRIKTVLTPIDFSDNSGLVVESAAYMAGTFKADLHVIYIVQNFEDYSGFFVPQMNVPNIEHELFVGAEQQMEKFCNDHNSFFETTGVSEVVHKVLVGDVSEKIVEYADEAGGDMIVMGTHGYKGLERIMFGSVADKVVKSAGCPVMTINPYTCCG
jgi:nucleotide-binding universal stress UspA family protein